jgi:RNA polymerase sigma-70 factor (ECF subfamily)
VTGLASLSADDYQRAFRYACSLGADRDSAFDLVQTALVKCLSAAPAKIDKPLAYLLTSVRNCFYNESQRNKERFHVAIDDIAGVVATSLKPLEEVMIDRDTLRQIWDKLVPLERELLHLWAVEGHTLEEISDLTKTPKGTLLARLHRLRKRLKGHETLHECGELP